MANLENCRHSQNHNICSHNCPTLYFCISESQKFEGPTTVKTHFYPFRKAFGASTNYFPAKTLDLTACRCNHIPPIHIMILWNNNSEEEGSLNFPAPLPTWVCVAVETRGGAGWSERAELSCDESIVKPQRSRGHAYWWLFIQGTLTRTVVVSNISGWSLLIGSVVSLLYFRKQWHFVVLPRSWNSLQSILRPAKSSSQTEWNEVVGFGLERGKRAWCLPLRL